MCITHRCILHTDVRVYIYTQAFFFVVEPLVPIRRSATGLVPRLISARIADLSDPGSRCPLYRVNSLQLFFVTLDSLPFFLFSLLSSPPYVSVFFFFRSFARCTTTQHAFRRVIVANGSVRAEKVALSAREVNLNV